MSFSRADELQKYLDKSNSEWLLITDSLSARYLSGFVSTNVALLCSKTSQFLLTDFRYKEAAQTHCKDTGWEFHEIVKPLTEEISQLVGEKDSIDFQSNFMSVDTFDQFQKALPTVQFNPASQDIKQLFYAKEESEIAKIAEAAAIADRAYKRFLKELHTGVSEWDAAQRLEELCKEEGSQGPSFDTIMLFGERSALPHGTPRKDRTLQAGDVILTDFGCTVDGFCSDMTRTTYWESLSAKEKEIYELVLKAQLRGKELLRPGIKASAVDTAVRSIIADAGYGEYFGHGTGHGVGLRIHEAPAISRKDDTVLVEGMVVTVEPGIYIPELCGVRIEDLMVITADGARSLSSSPRELCGVREK